MKKRPCTCSLRLLPDAPKKRGFSEGCKVAEFSLFRGAHKRAVYEAGDVRDIALAVIPKSDLNRVEHVVFILVDARRHVRAIAVGSAQTHDRCGFRLGDVMKLFDPVIDHIVNPPSRAPASNIGGLFMAHNHPSGSALFSGEDVRVAYNVANAFRDVPFGLLDSLVVTDGGNYSSMLDFKSQIDGLRAVVTVPFRDATRSAP